MQCGDMILHNMKQGKLDKINQGKDLQGAESEA